MAASRPSTTLEIAYARACLSDQQRTKVLQGPFCEATVSTADTSLSTRRQHWRTVDTKARAKWVTADTTLQRLDPSSPVESYMETARDVLERFLRLKVESMDDSRQAYVIGYRLTRFLRDILPQHDGYDKVSPAAERLVWVVDQYLDKLAVHIDQWAYQDSIFSSVSLEETMNNTTISSNSDFLEPTPKQKPRDDFKKGCHPMLFDEEEVPNTSKQLEDYRDSSNNTPRTNNEKGKTKPSRRDDWSYPSFDKEKPTKPTIVLDVSGSDQSTFDPFCLEQDECKPSPSNRTNVNLAARRTSIKAARLNPRIRSDRINRTPCRSLQQAVIKSFHVQKRDTPNSSVSAESVHIVSFGRENTHAPQTVAIKEDGMDFYWNDTTFGQCVSYDDESMDLRPPTRNPLNPFRNCVRALLD